MADYLVTDTELTSVANAIRTKGGTNSSLSFPTGFVNAIEGIQTSGGNTVSGPFVKFYDYDGTLITTKTKAEINAMTDDTDLPANPSHTGLVAEGWNWTVSELKAQLLACPESDIIVGQTYDTTSGDTEIGITLTSQEALSPSLGIVIDGSVSVDWGDGTEPSIVTGNNITSIGNRPNTNHTYTNIGDYIITVHLVSGKYAFLNNNTSSILYYYGSNGQEISKIYSGCVNYIRFGSDISYVGGANYASYLKTVTISKNIEDKTIRSNAFLQCLNLSCIVIPKEFTKLDSDAFNNCIKLKTVSLPKSITTINNSAFRYDYMLENILFPLGIKTLGNNVLYNCYSLNFLELPSSITSIGSSLFSACYSLNKVIMHFSSNNLFKQETYNNCYNLNQIIYTLDGSELTIGTSCFSSCYRLNSFTIPPTIKSINNYAFNYTRFEEINIPNTVTSIGNYAFGNMPLIKEIIFPPNITSLSNYVCSGCSNLKKVTIPEGVIGIGSSAFTGCTSLTEITIPSTVVSIGTNALSSNKGLRKIILLPNSPPTLTNTNTFSGILDVCKIYVPYSEDHSVLNDYMTASNWSTYASQMEELPAPTT